MATRDSILSWVAKDLERPIYEIRLIENPNTELVTKEGRRMGLPDEGAVGNMGFYYDIDDAIEAMHTNRCGIQDDIYKAGFVMCRREGLYSCIGRENRIYFIWDGDRGGFFETDEPHVFWNVAY